MSLAGKRMYEEKFSKDSTILPDNRKAALAHAKALDRQYRVTSIFSPHFGVIKGHQALKLSAALVCPWQYCASFRMKSPLLSKQKQSKLSFARAPMRSGQEAYLDAFKSRRKGLAEYRKKEWSCEQKHRRLRYEMEDFKN
jgi:hypothetical protein